MTLDAPPSEQVISDVIAKIFRDSTIKPTIEIEPGSNVGEGFLGITALVTAKFDKDAKYFFMKMAAQNAEIRKIMLQKDVFNKEAYFYSKIHPTFNELSLRYTKKDFDVTAKSVYVSIEDSQECIVLENLVRHNYKLNKSNYFDRDHFLMVMKAYSRLHAYGFILKKQYPEKFEEFCKASSSNLTARLNEIFGMKKIASKCVEILKKHIFPEEDQIILDHLEKIESKLIEAYSRNDTQDEYLTIAHGDCWKNNMMFKYDNKGKVEDVKLLDLQLWSINSPVFDILHVFYPTVNSKEVLDDLYYYLEFYYASLCEVITQMGENPEDLYPHNAFLSQFKQHSLFGLCMALIITRGLMMTIIAKELN